MDQNLDSHKRHQNKLKLEKSKMEVQARKQLKEKNRELLREKADMYAKYKKERSQVVNLSTQLDNATTKVLELTVEVTALKKGEKAK